jgi:hypothetical protein
MSVDLRAHRADLCRYSVRQSVLIAATSLVRAVGLHAPTSRWIIRAAVERC